MIDEDLKKWTPKQLRYAVNGYRYTDRLQKTRIDILEHEAKENQREIEAVRIQHQRLDRLLAAVANSLATLMLLKWGPSPANYNLPLKPPADGTLERAIFDDAFGRLMGVGMAHFHDNNDLKKMEYHIGAHYD